MTAPLGPSVGAPSGARRTGPRHVTPPTEDERGAARSGTVRRAGQSIDLRSTLKVIRRGGGDPTWADDTAGAIWKAWRTPAGPVTVRVVEAGDDAGPAVPPVVPAAVVPGVRVGSRSETVRALAWGPGAEWVLDRLPSVLGGDDDFSGFVPRHERVAAAWRTHPGWRVPRTGLVLEALVPSIIEQRVTGVEAFASYRRLVRAYGEPAPGPGAARGMFVAPDARGWTMIPSWAWVRAGVDAGRSAAVVRSARVAGRLEEGVELDLEAARARLCSVPGVGGWTVAEVAHVALGDADAVSLGDYHVAKDMGWALTGSEVDDAGLVELLAPDAPHRYRVQRLLELSGAHRPRRGPRMTLPTHLPR